MNRYGATRHSPKYLDGCKNSHRILWMKDSVSIETHNTSSSHEPSLEPMRRVVPGNHSIHTHFPRDQNCEICHRTKITRAPCRRRTREVAPRAKKWWLDNSRSQNSQWRMWISKISPICSCCARLGLLNGFNHIRGEQKLGRNLKGACKSSWSQLGNQKSFTLTISRKLARHVKISRGIIVRRPLIRNKCYCWESSAQI